MEYLISILRRKWCGNGLASRKPHREATTTSDGGDLNRAQQPAKSQAVLCIRGSRRRPEDVAEAVVTEPIGDPELAQLSLEVLDAEEARFGYAAKPKFDVHAEIDSWGIASRRSQQPWQQRLLHNPGEMNGHHGNGHLTAGAGSGSRPPLDTTVAVGGEGDGPDRPHRIAANFVGIRTGKPNKIRLWLRKVLRGLPGMSTRTEFEELGEIDVI